jgi:cytochrome b involved in lipid metabolism
MIYDLDDVSKHNSENDVWICIDNYVYDVTSWLNKHPGGKQIIMSYAGSDATDQFFAFHNPAVC